ncbi:MAG: site-specific DNA-methyltransferase [Candidatus Cloacimonetes bacterium]|jgi:DNA modification methylase|nr:site-specific DNA-methyltransferase [Candidatus Cloacimonadota bacterium]
MKSNVIKYIPTSTVGRGKSFSGLNNYKNTDIWNNELVNLYEGDSLDFYKKWEKPITIISDGAYGILGFEGDTSDHFDLPAWYEPHIKEWSKVATPQTTLWFWNTEIGWATIHPLLEKYGWRYVQSNIWNKGKGHIAGNVNTSKIRRFPVVTEVCVQYIFEARINGLQLREWLRAEWKRTGLPLKKANEACGVKDAATRKYFDKGHLWYFPPPKTFEKMAEYANSFGNQDNKPYFSSNGKNPMKSEDWAKMRSKFTCPHGFTNCWDRNSLRGKERIKAPKKNAKSAHLNQKPLDLMKILIEASTRKGDVIWEPFGGLFSASLAASFLGRKAYSCEIDSDYFKIGINRFI